LDLVEILIIEVLLDSNFMGKYVLLDSNFMGKYVLFVVRL